MPKIQWTNLPPALRVNLFERFRERKITAEDLYQLKTWRSDCPVARASFQLYEHRTAVSPVWSKAENWRIA